MRFANPEYLYALGLIPLLLIFFARSFRKKAEAFEQFGNRDLLLKLSRTTSFRRQRIKAGLLLIGFTFCLLAIARPQMGGRTEIVKREGIEVMVTLDVSTSMLAEDVKPNRLIRAVCVREGVSFTLEDSPQQSLAATLRLGAEPPFCMEFGGDVLQDTRAELGRLGRFKAEQAPAPTSCPVP